MKPLQDYSFLKGVNHGFERDEAALRRHLGYGKRLGINSVRIWLSYKEFANEGAGYVDALRQYIRVCDSEGVTVMPILFNGNGIDPAILEEAFLPEGETFAKAIVEGVKDEPGLIMWDIMNEPPCNPLILEAPSQEVKDGWYAKIWKFVRHFCKFVKGLDPVNAITVGNWLAVDMESSADLVDVLSYHDYSTTLKGVTDAAELALSVGKKYGKPVINNETCCIARANPYDTVIQKMNELHIPWYVFNLMIEGYWNDVHGIFYEDGTVRDPAIAAAIVGCFRNRDLNALVPEKPNREQQATKSVQKAAELLSDSNADGFGYGRLNVSALLDVCEEMANLLEAGQLAPMQIPPTARIAAWRKQEHPNELEVKSFTYELAKTLKDACQML